MVLVRSHKGSWPARVVASDRTITELGMWVNTLRPLFVQEDYPLLFCTRRGDRLVHISRKLSDLAKSFGSTIPPATAVRKAIATAKSFGSTIPPATAVRKAIGTAGGALGEGEKSALAHSMSHSKSTADAYYRAYGEAKSVEGFQAVGNLLEIPRLGRNGRDSQRRRPSVCLLTSKLKFLRMYSEVARPLMPFVNPMGICSGGAVGVIYIR